VRSPVTGLDSRLVENDEFAEPRSQRGDRRGREIVGVLCEQQDFFEDELPFVKQRLCDPGE
jgi:hypothetical protein